MKPTKTNRQIVKGIQKSIHDQYVPEFTEPGDCLEWPLYNGTEGMKPITASSIAKRMELMIPNSKFHSFVDTPKGVVCVRMRLPNEIPSKEETVDTSEEE